MDVSLNHELVGYWPMDEGSGSVLTRDDSGWSNTGTLTNITDSNWKDGISGKCIDFNGTDEYIDCSNNSSLDITNEISISAWIYINSGAPSCVIVTKAGSGTYQYMLFYDPFTKKVMGYLESSGVGSSANGSIGTNRWIHVVMVYNKTDVRYYIDGVFSGIPHNKTDSITSTNYNVIIGKYSTGYHFDGKIDEVRIYNRALNTDEIEYLYNNPSGVNKNLVSARVLITDLDGDGHTITDNIEFLEVNNTLSYASDTFELILANYNDDYSYIDFGCNIEILMGIGGYNSKKLTGIATDVVYTLDDELVSGRIEIIGEDIGYRSNNIYIFDIIEHTELSDILKAILNRVDIGTNKTIRELAGIDSDYSNIESTIYTPEITKFGWTSLSTAINELAEYAGYDWYIDVNKKLHFYDVSDVAAVTTITQDHLVGNLRIGTYEKTVNKAIVFGGYTSKVDQRGNPYIDTYIVTNTVSKDSSFAPANDLLYYVRIWTELVSGSDSNLVLTIEDDLSNTIPGSTKIVYKSDIKDGGYTEFKYTGFLNLIIGQTYHLHFEGTTTDGVKIAYGIVDSVNKLDFTTSYPVRIGSVTYDSESCDKYGLLMDMYVDHNIDDIEIAQLKSLSMMNSDPKRSVTLSIDDDTIYVGDVVDVDITTSGIQLNKSMKVMTSILALKHVYIENTLELNEI